MRFSRVTPGLMAAVVLCVLLGGRCAAVAQDDISEADKETLRHYELTIPKIDKLEAVVRKLVAAAKADPQIRKEMEAIGAERDGSIDTVTDKFNKLAPRVAAVLKAEGTDPREFLVGLMSTMLARMAAEFKGTASAEAAPDFVPAGNVAFAETHKPRLDLLEKAMSELSEAGKSE